MEPGGEVETARAKVNLWLNVVGRRDDGYHLLHSLVAFADLGDTLRIAPADGLSLVVEGLGAADLPTGDDNLVLRAARLLAGESGEKAGAAFRLVKRIPAAAGLGGGSADAAAALRGLCRLWRLGLPSATLSALAARLGADVPMCLGQRACLASGVGEKLEPAPSLPSCGLVLVNPGVALSTPQVFAARRGDFSPPRPIDRPWSDLAGLVAALAVRGNDLTEAAVAIQPVVGEVLVALRGTRGVRYAAMSGSGATCFALYDTVAAAERAANDLPAPWWRHVGHLR
ncbi:4-(cytidine 5'-diphospho)-2-C-methyl-D-erythritol kinase [Enhydrobacter sp.]|jgi:4-diphosphocytidyl-2-C-methyl-D-erythritol kinase|uniref:4-(cytidine 5'-diphospho)-2-C-methyl-D-erythritol kinase n=1 Tax=Enhydrobacter sp. TaxID=1894999 RepID=UPI00260A0552|nr:4-(cytidine 5'-diphospho)-2-C-methyl-D-erythritol kinase [Enhydrobacter sp.]WIM10015.1 MAG: 4-diphosphocytidyl-2-C-methyl-D-erythritol kinase [Enhydrobacter sp.]